MTPIYFLVEGKKQPYRCECRAGLFRIGTEVNGQTELVCSYRKRHRVLSGFYIGEPAEDIPTLWLRKVLRGEQLVLPFPEFRPKLHIATNRPWRWVKE